MRNRLIAAVTVYRVQILKALQRHREPPEVLRNRPDIHLYNCWVDLWVPRYVSLNSLPARGMEHASVKRRYKFRSSPMIRKTTLSLFCFLRSSGMRRHSSSTGSSPAFSATASDSPTLIVRQGRGKWGYANEKGQLVINPQFHSSLIILSQRVGPRFALQSHANGSRSLAIHGMDISIRPAEAIVTPQYQEASNFSEGLAASALVMVAAGQTKSRPRPGYYCDGNRQFQAQFGVTQISDEGLAQVCIGKCDWTEGSGYNGKFALSTHPGHSRYQPNIWQCWRFKNGSPASICLAKQMTPNPEYVDKTGKVDLATMKLTAQKRRNFQRPIIPIPARRPPFYRL